MSNSVEWGKERTIQLFDYVRKRECIWNPDYPNNTPFKKRKAWDEIAWELQEIDPELTLFDVKHRYNNFRNQYIRLVRNYELTAEEPKSYLYNLLSFIPIPPRCKTPFKWSTKQTSKIIALLKPHECLWLKQDKNYNNIDVKEDAMNVIHQEMIKYIPELTLANVIKKIRVLKYSFYCYERRKGKTKFRQNVPWWYTKLSYMKRNILKETEPCFRYDQYKTELFEVETADSELMENNEDASVSEMDDDNDDDVAASEDEQSHDIVKYRWPKNAVLKLLKLLECHECLWLKSHPHFNKSEIRDQVTRQILKKLHKNYPNLSLYFLQRKISQMKYAFNTYNSKKEMKLRRGKTPPWWYAKLAFMEKNLKENNGNGSFDNFDEILLNDIKEEEMPVFEKCAVDNLSEIKIEPVLFERIFSNNHCRICLENNGEFNLNDALGENTNETYIECIGRYFQLDHDDTIEDMPKKICTNCANKVTATFELAEKISKSNAQLNNILSSRKYLASASSTIHEDLIENTDDIFIEEVEEENGEQYMDINDEEMFLESENDDIISVETIHIDRISTENNLNLIEHNDSNNIEEPLMDIDAECDIKNESENEEAEDNKTSTNETQTHQDICKDDEDSDSDIPVVPKKKIRYKGPRPLCHICSETFKNPMSLQAHLERHDENRERKYTCEICGLKSYTINRHNEHKKIHNPNRTKYQCEYCDKSYYTVSSLNVHRKLHTGDLFQCSLCPKTFNTQVSYTTHINVHTGNKTLECDICGEKFFRSSRLHEHKQDHYNVKWKCPECPKEYPKRKSLREHMLSHSGYPFQCDICGMGKPSKYKCKFHIMQVHKIDDPEEAMTHMKTIDVKMPKTASFKDLITPEKIAALSKTVTQNVC